MSGKGLDVKSDARLYKGYTPSPLGNREISSKLFNPPPIKAFHHHTLISQKATTFIFKICKTSTP
jgi:hypothetical protein